MGLHHSVLAGIAGDWNYTGQFAEGIFFLKRIAGDRGYTGEFARRYFF